ncbi:MAG: DUF2442 domain-containing protein [Chitinophagaceae bacterium]|nr:DUF2442 domain-containing protein [Chitinophagaceae bacterium]
METTIKNIKKIWLTDKAICVETKKGKTAKEMFADYPRLKYATPAQRKKYTTSYFGIHWEEIDEDLSFEGFFKKKSNTSKLFKVFDQLKELNVSAFARRVGISQPLMAAYLNGSKAPSENRKKEIEKELHKLGSELLSVEL